MFVWISFEWFKLIFFIDLSYINVKEKDNTLGFLYVSLFYIDILKENWWVYLTVWSEI